MMNVVVVVVGLYLGFFLSPPVGGGLGNARGRDTVYGVVGLESGVLFMGGVFFGDL